MDKWTLFFKRKKIEQEERRPLKRKDVNYTPPFHRFKVYWRRLKNFFVSKKDFRSTPILSYESL